MTPRYLQIPAVLATAVLLGACGGADDTAAADSPPVSTTSVQVVDNAFEPVAAEVAVGDTLTWRWEGSAKHNVVGDGFSSPVQDDGTYDQRFTEPGTYPYQCTLHDGMTATVTVVSASEGS